VDKNVEETIKKKKQDSICTIIQSSMIKLQTLIDVKKSDFCKIDSTINVGL